MSATLTLPKICTRRRSHLPFDTGDTTPGGTYSFSLWDHETWNWDLHRTGLKLMQLREVIRSVESDGWSSFSYLIERDYP